VKVTPEALEKVEEIPLYVYSVEHLEKFHSSVLEELRFQSLMFQVKV
jgi:hypothetical protein